MKLVKLAICNYRSFGERVEIPIDDITTFIGDNSAGKTSALSAFNCIFSPFSKERIISKRDFHAPQGDEQSLTLYIEVHFLFDELNNETRESAIAKFPQVAVFSDYLTGPDAEGHLYLRVRLEASWEQDSTIDGNVVSHVYYIKTLDVNFPESAKTGANYVDLSRIRSIYIPAVRDPSALLRNASGNMLGQLLGCLNWNETNKENIDKGVKALSDLFNAETGVSWIANEIQNKWGIYNSDSRYNDAKFSLNNVSIESLMKSAGVVFSSSNGDASEIDKLGDGLRSLFYISMIDGLLQVEEKIHNEDCQKACENDRAFKKDPPFYTIISLEEPENHIAPHLLGKLMKNLKMISSRSNAQILVSSHSPAIVKRIKPTEIRFFRIDTSTKCSCVKTITLPSEETLAEQNKFVKEAVTAYPELYFAKLVILVEGDSEEIILPKYWNAKYQSLDEKGTSVVPLGGRYVNHFWRLLEDLCIPYVTLLDLDRERGQGGWLRIKYAFDQLLEKKVIIPADVKDEKGNVVCVDEMKNWSDADISKYDYWINFLESYDVFFSSPLDVDFLMLEKFPDVYKSISPENGGPIVEYSDDKGGKKHEKVKDEEKKASLSKEYVERQKESVHATLKSDKKNGDTYSPEEKKLMVWYDYLFLGKGKPSTHITALNKIEERGLLNNVPAVLDRLLTKAQTKIGA